MKNCDKCGHICDDEALFCNECGSAFMVEAIDVAPVAETEALKYYETTELVEDSEISCENEIIANVHKDKKVSKLKGWLNDLSKKKKIIILIIFIILLALILFIAPIRYVELTNENIDSYVETTVSVEDYSSGVALNYNWGISNYSSSTAKAHVVVKPKKFGIYNDVDLGFTINEYIWSTTDYSWNVIATLSKDGSADTSVNLESVYAQLFPASAPTIDSKCSSVSGSVWIPIIPIF